MATVILGPASKLSTMLFQLLEKRKISEALRLIETKKNYDCVARHGMFIVICVSTYLKGTGVCQRPGIITSWEMLLVKIAKIAASPEKLLESIIYLIHCAELDNRFTLLLQPLYHTLLRCKERARLLEWALKVVLQRVHELPVPNYFSIEGDTPVQVETNPKVDPITSILPQVVSFSVTFVSAARLKKGFLSRREAESAEVVRQRDVLVSFGLHLLGRPLAFVELEVCEHPGVEREAAARLVSMLSSLSGRMMWLKCAEVRELAELKNKRLSGDGDVDVDEYYADAGCLRAISGFQAVSNEALAVLAYLFLAEGFKLDLAPHVYHPVYIARRCFYLANSLMTQDSANMLVLKGLLLIDSALNRLADGSMPCGDLESPVQKTFCESLIHVTIQSTERENRMFGLYVLRKYLSKFDDRGRFQLFGELHKMTNHSGLRGELAVSLKDSVLYRSSYFRGARLAGLLSQYFSLPQGVETDLTQHVDEVLCCLNLLRFLVLRNAGGALGVGKCIASLCDGYLSQVRKEVEVLRLHFSQDLDQGTAHDRFPVDEVSGRTHNGAQPSASYLDENKRASLEGLTLMDLMESLSARVLECLELRP